MINSLFLGSFVAGIVLLVIVTLVVWLWALIDCIKSDAPTEEKLLWVIIIVLTNILGAILYFILKDTVHFTSRKVNKNSKNKNVLYRSTEDKMLAGVCGGIGEYFDIDPTIVRLIWVFATIFGHGAGVLIYIIAAIIIPTDKEIAAKNTKKEYKKSIKDAKNKTKKEVKVSGKKMLLVVILVLLLLIPVVFLVGGIIAFSVSPTSVVVEYAVSENIEFIPDDSMNNVYGDDAYSVDNDSSYIE
ncbi:MAG: PspC domain-containing protein [Candidatus Woesearchaeota archaeon]